nr:hypothetical protein [Vibrio parahaemolyticus]
MQKHQYCVPHTLIGRYVFKRKLCSHWKLKTVWS